MGNVNLTALRGVLLLAGIFAVYSGLDSALGGLLTLGWMEQSVFFEIADHELFLVADSHERFLGGVWTGIGLMIFLGLTNLKRYQSALNLTFALVFLGGLARFSQMNLDITFGPEVLWAVVVEIIGMPILFLWLSLTVRQFESESGHAEAATA